MIARDSEGGDPGGKGRSSPRSTLDRGALARLPAPAGLCARCAYLRLLSNRRSVFLRCARADSDPVYPRYPSLPVRECAGYSRSED